MTALSRQTCAPRLVAAVWGDSNPLRHGQVRARVSPARTNGFPGFPERQLAVARQPSALTGRHGAPTWGPTQWGGEGTTSREVVACKAVSARRA
jgi:hypothetical protein